MGQGKYQPGQIIHELWQAEVELGQGAAAPQACNEIGMTDQTDYR
jgi:hypothetical protein